ncbi:hypothetical protein B566_EDAN015364 [Ephemera danica]|nr:hypothetical protein B566_EDAN015364 [Ephemera danica]
MKKGDNAEEMGSYFHGDMLIPMSRMKFDPNAAREIRWQGGIVPYELDSGFSNERSLIQRAMRLLEQHTCVRFEPRSGRTRAYVAFERKQDGCWSALGRTGGRQIINLQPNGCFSPGTVIHEMMHALGLPHEQSRQDRDRHVRIIWSNIRRGEEPQFAIHRGYNGIDSNYDFISVMHYGLRAFSKINRLYGCQATSNTVRTTQRSNTAYRFRPQIANRNFYRFNYNNAGYGGLFRDGDNNINDK